MLPIQNHVTWTEQWSRVRPTPHADPQSEEETDDYKEGPFETAILAMAEEATPTLMTIVSGKDEMQ
jgi:hypothetical protein